MFNFFRSFFLRTYQLELQDDRTSHGDFVAVWFVLGKSFDAAGLWSMYHLVGHMLSPNSLTSWWIWIQKNAFERKRLTLHIWIKLMINRTNWQKNTLPEINKLWISNESNCRTKCYLRRKKRFIESILFFKWIISFLPRMKNPLGMLRNASFAISIGILKSQCNLNAFVSKYLRNRLNFYFQYSLCQNLHLKHSSYQHIWLRQELWTEIIKLKLIQFLSFWLK